MRTQRRGMHGYVDLPTITVRTSKRMKHIFDNPAHVAFHPRKKDGTGFEQTEAWNAIKNWYFKTSDDGTRVVFSYRDSYPIASRFELGRKTIFLLRAGKGYGPTTNAQMSATRHAVPKDDKGVEVFTVPCMVSGYDHSKPGQREHAMNLEQYVADINGYIATYGKARSSYNLRGALSGANSSLAELRRYVRVFKLKMPAVPKIPKMDQTKLDAIVQRELNREQRRDEKRRVEREEYERQHQAEVAEWMAGPDACKHLKEDGTTQHGFNQRYQCERQREEEEWQATKEEKIAAWKRGENVELRVSYSEPAFLRVRGDNVETSQGADVPLDHAKALLDTIRKVRERGEDFVANGRTIKVGHYSVSRISHNDADGVTAIIGCHKLSWASISEVAEQVDNYLMEAIAWG